MNPAEYTQLLGEFKMALQERIPYAENCVVQFYQDPQLIPQFGPYAVICSLQTESSGEDQYIIYKNPQTAKMEFIRNIRKGDRI